MTASRRPRPFSSRSFVQILLVTLVLRLPAPTDACDEIPRYVSMKPKGNPEAPVSAGFTAEYECRPGYRLIVPLVRPTSTVCQADGTWAPPLQDICTRKSCPHPGDPLNGRVEGSTRFGSQMNYFCNEGYDLVGNSVLRCELSGNEVTWSGDPPQCNKILCKPPPQIQNGEFTNSHKDTFEYSEVVTYKCKPSGGSDPYSLVGNSTLRCSGRDEWSSDPPECKVVRCEFPSVTNGKLVSGFGTKFYYKHEVQFECNEGYSLKGSPKIVCEANATWVPEKPRCDKVTYLEQKFCIVNSLEILWDGVRNHHIVKRFCVDSLNKYQMENSPVATRIHLNIYNEIVTYSCKPSVDQMNIHWLERAGSFVLGLIDGTLNLLSVKVKSQ
uniref:Membrane cofactor protein n=1 Tax=Pipistrellus kuhlii TaxID=59472 RepID=A0A7J7USI1_PIPKU|nr:hypothetical protein mPipKuh1_002421 [Pipistrellus kuhlii]